MDYSAAMWVGQGFRGFLDLHEKVFFLMQCPGVHLPPQVEFFLTLGSYVLRKDAGVVIDGVSIMMQEVFSPRTRRRAVHHHYIKKKKL